MRTDRQPGRQAGRQTDRARERQTEREIDEFSGHFSQLCEGAYEWLANFPGIAGTLNFFLNSEII